MSLTTSPETPVSNSVDTGRLRWRERIGYAFGDVGSCLYFVIFMNYMAYFYTDIFGISAAALGTMIFVVRTIDWITDIIMGAIADRTKSKHGRYRPYLLWSIIPYVLTGWAMFYTPGFDANGKLIYAYITYILVTSAYTMVNVPYSAMIGVMTPNAQEKTILSSARMIGSSFANLTVYATIFPLIHFFGGEDKQRGFFLAVVTYSILAAGAFFFTFISTRERIQPAPVAGDSLGRDVKLLFKNWPWLILIVTALLMVMSMSLRGGATVHYFKYVAGNESLASGLFVVGSLIQIVSVSFTSTVAKFFKGKKMAFCVLMALASLLNFVFYFIPAQNYQLILAHTIVATIIGSPIVALFFSMIADSASYGLWKLDQRSTGLLFSAGTFSLKIGWSIGPAMAMWYLGYLGFQANQEQNPATLQGLKMLMSILPCIFGLITVAVLLFFYPINGRMEKEIEAGLRAKGI